MDKRAAASEGELATLRQRVADLEASLRDAQEQSTPLRLLASEREAVERADRVAQEAQKTASTLRALLDSMADEVWACDAEGNMSLLNAVTLPGIGLAPPEHEREPLSELVPKLEILRPDGTRRPTEESPLLRSLKGEVLHGEEIFRHLQTGELRDRQYTSAPIRDGSGQIIGAVAVVRDITARKRAQAERERLIKTVAEREVSLRTEQEGVAEREGLLREVEQRVTEVALERDRLRALVASIADEVWFCDDRGNLTLLNEAVIEGLGFERPELAYEALNEVVSKLEILLADGRPRPAAQAPLFRSLQGETIRDEEEIVRHLQTGELRYRQVSAAPVRGEDGTIVGAVAVVRDITKRKETEADRERLLAEVQRRAAELQAVLDNMVDAVFVCAPDGRIMLTNAAATRLLGPPNFSDVGNLTAAFPTLFQLRHPDGTPIQSKEMATARALAGETVMEMSQVVHNAVLGQDRYLHVSAAPIRDAEGTIVGAVTVVRDITELTELDRLKEQFIAVAAHELKTPVAIMKGYAQALLRRADDVAPKGRRMLEAVNRGADRITAVVQDLLDISKLHAGQLELETERIDLPALIAEISDRVALGDERHHIRLGKMSPVVVHGDRGRLEQVLINLLDNAIKYSPAGGDIDIAVSVHSHEAVVAVRDQGIGIPKEKQRRIFQRFYSAHTSTPYDYGGMGVGLYISNEIVKRHGGRTWFESEEGNGSTFYFSLPLPSK